MFRALRIAIAAVVVTGAFAGVAGATVSPTGPVTLTAATGVRLSSSVTCTGAGGTATLVNSNPVSTNVQLTFAGCGLYTVTCAATGRLTALGSTVSGVTPFSMSMSCTGRLGAATCGTVSGSVLATFSNTTSALRVNTASQALTGTGCLASPTLVSSSGGAAVTYTFSPTTTITF
jgi:hypothetical protein